MTTLNRLRSNHFNLNESLARKGYIESATCECGAEVESLNYVVIECTRHEEERRCFKRVLNKERVREPYCAWNWLRESNWKILIEMCKFLKKIKGNI